MPHRRTLPTLLPLFLLFFYPPELAANSPTAGNFNCGRHDPRASQNKPSSAINCLHYLNIKPELYSQCNDTNSDVTCYIFLQEPPFVTLRDVSKFNRSDEAFKLQRPFPCGNYKEEFKSEGGITGIALQLHNETSSKTDLCMWGGHAKYCTFNQLVDYTSIMADHGYRFAITGLLLELPQRQCDHDASAPFVDNSMIIIGKKTEGGASSPPPFIQLTRPFTWDAWVVFATIVFLFIVVCISIAVRFHVFRGRSLITAFFIFAGERDDAIAHENETNESTAAAMSFATKYGLAMTLYRIALLAFIAIFVLFYEVAVVNFLFQQHNLTIQKRVTSLSRSDLKDYAVLKESALENVWNTTVIGNKGDGEKWNDSAIPWSRCETATECIDLAKKEGHSNFVVTFEVVGKYLLLTKSDCEELTIFETKDVLYQFNAGWLYNSRVNEVRRKQVDRELVGLRIKGRTRHLIDEELREYQCKNEVTADIGPMIILIPCLIFVFPPLVGSVLVLVLWKRRRRRERRRDSVILPRLDSERDSEKRLSETSDVCVP